MRISRSKLLSAPSGQVHLYWRAHNREFLLKGHNTKKLYFESMIAGLEHRSTNGNVKLSAFCGLDNHNHGGMSYQGGSKYLSNYMRVAHSRFGQRFNKLNGRTGKVANERPRTSLIGDTESQMRAHFYIEANPIRAGITTFAKLRQYYWNSYRFYAYGELDEVTSKLTPPEWYIALGKTPKERQSAYRKLFKAYLEYSLVPSSWFFKRFIGAAAWVEEQEQRIKKELAALRALAAGSQARLRGVCASPPAPS